MSTTSVNFISCMMDANIIFQFGVGNHIDDEVEDAKSLQQAIKDKRNQEVGSKGLSSLFKSKKLSLFDSSKELKSTCWQITVSPDGLFVAVLLTAKLIIFSSSKELTAKGVPLMEFCSLPLALQCKTNSRSLSWSNDASFVYIVSGDGDEIFCCSKYNNYQFISIQRNVFSTVITSETTKIIDIISVESDSSCSSNDRLLLILCIFTDSSVVKLTVDGVTGVISLPSVVSTEKNGHKKQPTLQLLSNRSLECSHFDDASGVLLLVSSEAGDS